MLAFDQRTRKLRAHGASRYSRSARWRDAALSRRCEELHSSARLALAHPPHAVGSDADALLVDRADI
jgi:hypothetical protein